MLNLNKAQLKTKTVKHKRTNKILNNEQNWKEAVAVARKQKTTIHVSITKYMWMTLRSNKKKGSKKILQKL